MPDEEILGFNKQSETKGMQMGNQHQQIRKPHVMMSPGSISSDDSMDVGERYKPPTAEAASPTSAENRGKNALPKGETVSCTPRAREPSRSAKRLRRGSARWRSPSSSPP